jgi:hypothetical protein
MADAVSVNGSSSGSIQFPPHPLATRTAGRLMLCGAVLVGLTVLIPPEAEGSDAVIAALGGIAGLGGLFLLRARHVPEAVLGVATALGSMAIIIATWQHGLGGPGPRTTRCSTSGSASTPSTSSPFATP